MITNEMSISGRAMDNVCPRPSFDDLSEGEMGGSPVVVPLANGAADGEELEVVLVRNDDAETFAP